MTRTTFARAWILLSVSVCVLAGSRGSAAQDEILWYKDLDDAVEVATSTDRPMMIDFWADWCIPCRVMDVEVYTDPTLVAAFDQKMIGVRIHVDFQPAMARRFNAVGLPYLVFTNSYGTELMHHAGFLEAEDLTAVVRAFPADVSELNRYDRALQEDKDHFSSLVAMGRRLQDLGFYGSSSGYFERALKHDNAKQDPATRETILYAMALNALQLMDGESAVSSLEQGLKEFPASARKPEFLLALGRAYVLEDETEKAVQALDRVIAEFPLSPASDEARDLLATLSRP